MDQSSQIVTVTLNTAIDRVLEVDGFAVGSHLPAREAQRYPAGKGINVSRGLARLGCDSIATGFVGQAESSQFEQLLAASRPGRSVCQLLSVRGRTRENITILDRTGHTDTHIRTPGYELTRHDVQRIVSKLGLLTREGTTLVFSGSLPRGMTSEDFDTLIYVAIGGGAHVVLDVGGKLMADSTSLDLATTGAGGERASGSKMLWMIKPNRHELAEALHLEPEALASDDAVIEAGRRLTERVEWLIVTLGGAGAILFCDQGIWRGSCELAAEDVVSTVGCGDCMLAGLLEGQRQGLDPADVLRRGVATGTANAIRAGVAEFDSELVREIEASTTIQKL